MSISNYLELKLLDKTLRNTDFTVTTVYASLHTGDPGETGASEAAGGSYVRQSMAFAAAASGSAANSAIVDFAGMPSATITHVGLWDASTSGNFLWGGALSASKVVNSGDTFRFAASALTVSVD